MNTENREGGREGGRQHLLLHSGSFLPERSWAIVWDKPFLLFQTRALWSVTCNMLALLTCRESTSKYTDAPPIKTEDNSEKKNQLGGKDHPFNIGQTR